MKNILEHLDAINDGRIKEEDEIKEFFEILFHQFGIDPIEMREKRKADLRDY